MCLLALQLEILNQQLCRSDLSIHDYITPEVWKDINLMKVNGLPYEVYVIPHDPFTFLKFNSNYVMFCFYLFLANELECTSSYSRTFLTFEFYLFYKRGRSKFKNSRGEYDLFLKDSSLNEIIEREKTF